MESKLSNSDLQDAVRAQVRTMLSITGWSASRLAKEAGLATSTLNRFLNKPVKHSLSQKTIVSLIGPSLNGALERLKEGKDVNKELLDGIVSIVGMAESFFGGDFEQFISSIKGAGNFIDSSQKEQNIRATKIFSDNFKMAIADAKKQGAVRGVIEAALTKPETIDVEHFIDREALMVSILKGPLGSSETITPENLFERLPDEIQRFYEENPQYDPRKNPETNDPVPVLRIGTLGTDIKAGLFPKIKLKVERPFFLKSSQNAFGLYINVSSHEPRYDYGSIIFANPNRQYRTGDYVVIESESKGLIVGRLDQKTELSIVASTLSPPSSFELSITDVRSISRIVGSYSPNASI